MTYLKYRICRYIHSLFDPSKFVDFGIIAASEGEISLFGINLVDLGCVVNHPFEKYIYEDSVGVVWRRVHNIYEYECQKKNIETGFDLLDKFYSGPTNLCFTEMISHKRSFGIDISAAVVFTLTSTKIWDGKTGIHGYKANISELSQQKQT